MLRFFRLRRKDDLLVDCGDGKPHFRYHLEDIDRAFPLYVKVTNTEGTADADVIGQITARVGAHYGNAIAGFFVAIDDTNGSMFQRYRAVHFTYNADPCNQAQWLAAQVEKIGRDVAFLQHLRMELAAVKDRLDKDLSDPTRLDDWLNGFRYRISSVFADREAQAAVAHAQEDTRKWAAHQ